ncbi:MAG: chalcone isomerase family protein [Acidobacteria bacterium]|nr:chalcone isomerase family protein [Acidobacteriota bacterium]
MGSSRAGCRSLGLALVLLATVAGAAATEWTEPSTGERFPLVRAGSQGALELTGGGVRKKLVFKVYAFALYADPAALRDGLAAWRGRPAKALRADPAVYDALAGLPAERLAVLAFVREVDSRSMREALDEAIARAVPAGDAARERFLGFWTGTIAAGEKIELSFSRSGEVTLARGGREVGRVASPALARALLACWLGQQTVSQDIRDGVVERLPAILGAPK